MRQYHELTVVEQGLAVDKALTTLLEGILEGAIRFDDASNFDGLQAAIDAACEAANANQTPWFAHEYVMEATYTVNAAGGYAVKVADTLRGMAQCDAEDAWYPDATESVYVAMISQFRLYVTTENAAFDDGEDGRAELARILRDTADRLEAGGEDFHWYQTLRDANGNDVGRAGIKPLEEEMRLPGAMSRER